MTAVGPTPSDLALDRAPGAPDPAQEDGGRWRAVCPVGRLTPGRGVAALVDGDQVAVFLLASGEVLAIDDRDPCSGVDVLSRGLVGDVAGEPTVASPLYKQRFELRTGRCLDDDSVFVQTWVVRVRDGQVEVEGP
jgi:NAD(P)H-dependent nitrite reductase small subunit